MSVDLTLRLRNGSGLDIRAPTGSTLSDTLAELAELAGLAGLAGSDCWSGSRHLSADEPIGGPGLRTGDVVSIGRAGPRAQDRGSVLQLLIVGGPGAGAISPLATGAHLLGRGHEADIVLPDPEVSRRHAILTVASQGITVRDLGSSNGTSIDGAPVSEAGAALLEGQMLRCGDCVLTLAPLPDPPVAGRVRADGRREVNRPPRALPVSGACVQLPAPPAARVVPRMHWATAIVTAAGGCVLALLLRSPLFLAFAALGPLSLIATFGADRWSARKGRRKDQRDFAQAEAAAQRALRAALRSELDDLRRAHPDPAQIRLITAPSCRIWERRAGDADALTVRLGLGEREATVRARRGHTDLESARHDLAPVTVDLRAGPLGIAGRSGVGLRLMRCLVAQLCALHAPGDLAVVGLLAESRSERWRWLRWLPQLRVAADDDAGRTAAVAWAVAELERRATTAPRAGAWQGPWIVLVIDGALAGGAAPAVARLLRDGPAAGITALCLDEETRLLPAGCAAVVQADPGHGPWGRLSISHPAAQTGREPGRILLDGLSGALSDELARSLSRLADPSDEAPAVPPTVRLVDVLGLPAPAAEDVQARWGLSLGLRTPLGAGAQGPVEFDLDRDGPHALIAGTTGSGKSELLQGIVAGLAATCRPADLAFVLVDYKGGAAFGPCAELPHVSGVVTDLDSHLTERALRSLTAELRRREALLARVGARDIATYRSAARSTTDEAEHLPHLVIVIDEFAALAQDLPQFVNGLVGIASRGRSLGVHLVLATQRPSGVVSPEIRANTSLRVALRTTDAAESIDVISTPAAASISSATPGRAYLSLAAGGAPVLLQVARASGRSPAAGGEPVRLLDRWRRPLGQPAEPSGRDDLTTIVEAIVEAAGTQSSPRAPWLPPLPGLLALTDSRLTMPTDLPYRVAIGLHDRPDEQAQTAFALDLSTGGSLLLAGSAQSGRTSALRSIAAAALGTGAGPVDLYVVDGAPGGGLSEISLAPGCRAALTADDPAALAALIRILGERVRDGDSRGTSQPALVLIDAVETLLAALEEADPGRGGEALLALLREAASGRMTVVVTGDRPALAGRVATAVSTKLLLPLRDPADYALAGILLRHLPDSRPPGRALLAPSGQEIQLAALGSGDVAGQRVELARLVAAAAPVSTTAIQIRALPRSIRRAAIGGERPGESSRDALLGVGGDDARPIWAPLFAPGARYLIAGPPGSGRTTALALIDAQARALGLDIAMLRGDGSGPSALPADMHPGTVILVDDGEELPDALIDQLARMAQDRLLASPMVATGNTQDPALTFRGLAAAVARRRTGILLAPAPGDADVFGLGPHRGRGAFVPGRGLLVGTGTGLGSTGGVAVTRLQLATP